MILLCKNMKIRAKDDVIVTNTTDFHNNTRTRTAVLVHNTNDDDK